MFMETKGFLQNFLKNSLTRLEKVFFSEMLK